MKFFDTETGTGTNIESATTIPSDDERVREFFKPLPSGHRLEFTEDGLPLIIEIPPLSQTEIDQQTKDKRIAWIDNRLNEIDKASVRSMRAKSNGRDSQEDRDSLIELDNEANTIREERKILEQ